MKKPPLLPSEAGKFVAGNEVHPTDAAIVELAQRAARAVAHFDFHEASTISTTLPLRPVRFGKRLETRAPFALPRCALLGVLLLATLSATAQTRSMVSDHKARTVSNGRNLCVQQVNNPAARDHTPETALAAPAAPEHLG